MGYDLWLGVCKRLISSMQGQAVYKSRGGVTYFADNDHRSSNSVASVISNMRRAQRQMLFEPLVLSRS